jgi:hypothetical protein
VSDDELRRAERAVAEGGGGEARLELSRVLARIGRTSDEVVRTLLPDLDDEVVLEEIALFARERACLDVSAETAGALVAGLEHAEVARYLKRFLETNPGAAMALLERVAEKRPTRSARRRARTLEELCRKLVEAAPDGERRIREWEIRAAFEGASETPPPGVRFEVRSRQYDERVFFDAFQPSEYETITEWEVVDRMSGKVVFSFRSNDGVVRVAIAADGRAALVLDTRGNVRRRRI